MIVIGIDGADPATVFRGANAGQLPNFAAMIDGGSSGPLYSVTTSSAGAWTSHLTGVDPETSGVRTFVVEDEDRFAQTGDIDVETYPEYIDALGKRVGCLNLPLTYPPLDLENGFSVSGQLTPVDEDGYANPSDIGDRLEELEYRIDFQYGDRRYGFIDDEVVDRVGLDAFASDTLDVVERRVTAAERLLAEKETDVFVMMFKDTDSLQHYFWQHVTDDGLEDLLLECYQLIDDFIGHVRTEYPDRNLVVFSDHGFRSFNRGEGRLVDVYENQFIPIASDLIPYGIKRNRWFAKLHYAAERLFTATADTSEARHTGEHHPIGVWLFDGPDAAAEPDHELGFLDLPALLLYLLDVPVPEAYQGVVPTEVTSLNRSPDYADRDIAVDRESREIADLTVQNLDALGYVRIFEGGDVDRERDAEAGGTDRERDEVDT